MVELALGKLRQICSHVAIVGNRPELGDYAEIVADAAEEIGPLGGIAAALRHATRDWLLLIPVDLPLLPAGLLGAWATEVLGDQTHPPAACFQADGRLQPLVCLLRRELEPAISAAILAGERKAMPVIERAAASVSSNTALFQSGLRVDNIDARAELTWMTGWKPGSSEPATRDVWFANVNTPEEFRKLEAVHANRKRSAAPPKLRSPG